MEGGERRLTLWDQMSAVDGGEGGAAREAPAGLTLKDVLCSMSEKRAAAPAPPVHQLSNRTLLDVIQEHDDLNARSSFKNLIESHHDDHHNKKAWKSFKDKLRLKRAGAAWISSVPIPASDVPIHNSNISNNNSRLLSLSRHNSVRYQYSAEPTQSEEDPSCSSSSSGPGLRPQITRRTSTRFGELLSAIPPESAQVGNSDSSGAPPARVPSLRPQMSRHNSTRFVSTQRQHSMHNRDAIDVDDDEDDDEEDEEGEEATSPHPPARQLAAVLAEERALSAREAVAAQEAAEAAAAAEREGPAENEAGTEAPVPVPAARMSLMDLMDYNMADEEEEEEEEQEAEEEEEEDRGSGGGAEHNCCVCMVRHKGAAFIPCGHTFCRLCSRELMVCRGNCPLCNRFILEILDIF